MSEPTSVSHPQGGYRYVPGIEPYSGGVRAEQGHRISHFTFRRPPAWEVGFGRIDRVLSEHGRPPSALCSVELRCPRPHSFEGFGEFNRRYRETLADRGLLLDGGVNPVARTNVAPVVAPPAETTLYGFGFTVAGDDGPAGEVEAPSFVIAGAGDLRDQSDLTADAIVRAGERWIDAGAERAQVVLDEMEARMAPLGVDWTDASMVDVYAAEPIHQVLAPVVLDRMGEAAVHGVHWHLAAPPVAGLTFEMDLRGGVTERWL